MECADAGDESDDEVVGGAYHEDKASKRERKRQEREAQRQVRFYFPLYFCKKSAVFFCLNFSEVAYKV